MSPKTFKTKVLPVKNKLYRFAFKLVGDSEEALDIVQEVFFKVWKRKNELDGVDNVEAWCMRATKNLSLDKLKAKKLRRADSTDGKTEWSAGEKITPYHAAEWNDTMNNINACIMALPDKQRQVIQLRDVEGYTYKEIADILQIDLNQVKVNLFRARKSVRENLLKTNGYGL